MPTLDTSAFQKDHLSEYNDAVLIALPGQPDAQHTDAERGRRPLQLLVRAALAPTRILLSTVCVLER